MEKQRTIKNRLRDIYKKTSIKRKLPIILALQIVVPLLLLGVISFRISENIIRTKSVNYSADLVSSMKFGIENYAKSLTLISQSILYEEEIYTALDNESGSNYSLEKYQLTNEMDNIFKRFLLTRSEIQGIFLVSQSGDYYITENSGISYSGNLLPYDILTEKARSAQGELIWYSQPDEHGEMHVYLARTVHNQDNFREIGLLVLEANKEYLSGLCEEFIGGDIQKVVILSEENKVIAGEAFELQNQQELLENIREQKGVLVDHKKDMLYTYTTIEDPNWHVVTVVSLKTLYSATNSLKIWVLLLALLSVIILSGMSWIIVVDFLKPINNLTEAMNAITPGGELGQVEVDREDELGMLSENFNTMSTEINYLVKWIYQEQLTRKDAQLKALQAQVNPHFLFNTLETINWLAQMNGVEEISEMVTALATIMDASIGRDNKLITIADELTCIKQYIFILQKRFGDKIKLLEDADDEALKTEIPRLLLQPLVENAVYHGLEPRHGRGTILIRAKCREAKLLIEIVDNGVGIEPERLNSLNQMLREHDEEAVSPEPASERKSVGIVNVNRRIKLFFGSRWGIRISSRVGCYTKITVTLPRNVKDEN